MDDKTTVINPAAGPDTPSLELLINPTITPPIMPEISPLMAWVESHLPKWRQDQYLNKAGGQQKIRRYWQEDLSAKS